MSVGLGRTARIRVLLLAVLAVILIALARWFSTWNSLEGRVLDAFGEPVAGALVAALPATLPASGTPWEHARLARSDARGRFRLRLRPGPYRLSSSHPLLEGLAGIHCFLEPRGVATPPLLLRMQPGPCLLEGRIEAAGAGADRARVALAPILAGREPRDGPVHFVEAEGGRFRLRLPAGTYGFATRARGCGDEEGFIRIAGPETRLDLTLRAAPSPAPRAVKAWIREQGRALPPLAGGAAAADLEGLAELVGPARIVALGEACHGTREFTQLNHRLIAFLVERMGFTLIALETSPPLTEALNAYVLEGAGDPEAAVAELGFWTGPTGEFLELVRWLRRHNSVPGRVKAGFCGIDIRSSRIPYAESMAFLARFDPPALNVLTGPLAGLRQVASDAPPPDRAQVEAWRLALAALLERLDSRRAALVARAGAAAFARQRQNLLYMNQFSEILGAGLEGFAARERAMAENFNSRFAQAGPGPGARAVLWAHNGHVAKGAGQDRSGLRSLGRLLELRWGPDYLVFGSAFRQGGFLAQSREREGKPVLTFTLAPEAEGTLDAALADAGRPLMLLDLRRLPDRGEVADWFRVAQGTWSIPSEFSPAEKDGYLEKAAVAERYDLLLFVEKVSPPSPAAS